MCQERLMPLDNQMQMANVPTCKVVARDTCCDLRFHISKLFRECLRVFWDVPNAL